MIPPMSAAALQHALAVLRLGAEHNMSIGQLLAAVESEVARRMPPENQVYHADRRPQKNFGLCPHCARPLTVWRGSSLQVGGVVIGCVSCQYSRVGEQE